MRTAVATTLAVLAVAGVGAGCGGDDGDGGGDRGSGATTRAAAVAPTTTDSGGGTSGASVAAGLDAQAVYQRDSPGVVTILASGFSDGGAGLGSGFVVGDDGRVATNAHVVTSGTGARIRPASEVFVRFGDGNQVDADIVGFDPFADVALLKVNPDGLELKPLPIGDVQDVAVGEPVAAIGSPFGEERSLSVGVISATDRDIESLTGFQISGALQTDAAINSGNSGGPLLDADGRVLGINSQIRTGSSGGAGSGVGFAVPANVVKRSLDQLRANGKVRYAYLGISTQQVYPQAAEHFDFGVDDGAAVQTVEPGGPAARAGIKGGTERRTFQEASWRIGGDIITKVGDAPIEQDSDISTALLDYLPGDTVKIEVVRGGERRTVDVTLGSRPVQTPAG